ALLSLSLTLILTFFKIPIFFLTGLHTYVHPEKAGSANNASFGLRAAARRPFSDSGSQLDGHHYLSSIPNGELKKRNKSKVKFDFDENNAHIFRLKLEEGESEPGFGVLINGNLIPVIFGFIGLTKAFLALIKISFENSASKRLEKQFSAIFGVLGFLVGIMIFFCICLPARMHDPFGLELISLALLWINPLAEILVNKNSYNGGVADKLVGNMFLNEAVLFWYQRLHASKVSDLDFSRAKILLHNHYLCLAVLQLFTPPILVLVFLGLSQVDTNSFDKYNLVCASLFMAWWIIFVWVVITSASLVFYCHATLYIF
ncbi:hypothetical protein E1A91_D08G122600v1, partial [Gossypium mustelinum]